MQNKKSSKANFTLPLMALKLRLGLRTLLTAGTSGALLGGPCPLSKAFLQSLKVLSIAGLQLPPDSTCQTFASMTYALPRLVVALLQKGCQGLQGILVDQTVIELVCGPQNSPDKTSNCHLQEPKVYQEARREQPSHCPWQGIRVPRTLEEIRGGQHRHEAKLRNQGKFTGPPPQNKATTESKLLKENTQTNSQSNLKRLDPS